MRKDEGIALLKKDSKGGSKRRGGERRRNGVTSIRGEALKEGKSAITNGTKGLQSKRNKRRGRGC